MRDFRNRSFDLRAPPLEEGILRDSSALLDGLRWAAPRGSVHLRFTQYLQRLSWSLEVTVG